MSSWFSGVTVPSSLGDWSKKVQDAMPKIDVDKMILENKQVLQKLTLTTPELSAERARIEEEERRKEHVRDMLAGMLPWETRDAERDILVEECREAILQLSSDKQTFTGPYRLPEAAVNLKSDRNNNKTKKQQQLKEGGEDVDESAQQQNIANEQDTTASTAEGDADDNHNTDSWDASTTLMPSKESLEKLAKLEPLPAHLRDFDFDAHVGLIQRLLAMDPKLVKMQSSLSGGGERERVFWRNYFFHCAFTRYEAGLSIDEIWSEQALEEAKKAAAENTVTTVTSKASSSEAVANDEEVTITFDDDHDAAAKQQETAFRSDPVTDPNDPFDKSAPEGSAAASASEGTDFEMVDDDNEGESGNVKSAAAKGGGDGKEEPNYELDELEAEIARELED